MLKDLRQFGSLYKNIVAENKKHYENYRKASIVTVNIEVPNMGSPPLTWLRGRGSRARPLRVTLHI